MTSPAVITGANVVVLVCAPEPGAGLFDSWFTANARSERYLFAIQEKGDRPQMLSIGEHVFGSN